MAKRIKIGDVFEIPVPKGLAYAQYYHRNSKYGALVRILTGIFKQRPADLGTSIGNREAFSTFFPLQAAVNRGIFEIIGNYSVPEFAKPFPIFRSGSIHPKTGKVENWWLWDGEKEWLVGSISSEQRKFPIRGIWNDTLLIERIEEGWTPENDPT